MTITSEDVYKLAPFVRTLGVEFTELTSAVVAARLHHAVELSTTGGGLHGGALMGLADAAAAVCAVLNAAPGALPATTDSTTHFLRPIHGLAHAVAEPMRASRTAVVVEVKIVDESGELCVHVIQTVQTRGPAAAG
ncbi:PaaI family thioesterase [Nocardia vinacea]|uniref:PaaI family thioesterase n=1 Tax=Nocardia vinacea TaxID=96468 RepID=A0ABZ1Z085_9NOCA|nr:PaaI family thioesterase [Nocardia vinacea]